jgi:hypothetical protein
MKDWNDSREAMMRRSTAIALPVPTANALSRCTPIEQLPHLLAADELRALLGIGKNAVYQLLTERGVRIGRRRFLPRRVVEELVRGGG